MNPYDHLDALMTCCHAHYLGSYLLIFYPMIKLPGPNNYIDAALN